ncbi:hypothetical protein D3C75_548590 [compost metagenome]
MLDLSRTKVITLVVLLYRNLLIAPDTIELQIFCLLEGSSPVDKQGAFDCRAFSLNGEIQSRDIIETLLNNLEGPLRFSRRSCIKRGSRTTLVVSQLFKTDSFHHTRFSRLQDNLPIGARHGAVLLQILTIGDARLSYHQIQLACSGRLFGRCGIRRFLCIENMTAGRQQKPDCQPHGQEFSYFLNAPLLPAHAHSPSHRYSLRLLTIPILIKHNGEASTTSPL